MTDPIDFLEQLGRNARLRHAPPEELQRTLAKTDIDPELRSALLVEDTLRLGELLGAEPNICCLVEKPEEPDEEEDEEEEPDEKKAIRLR